MLKKEFKNKLLSSVQDSLKNTLVDILFTPLPVNNINSLLSESTQTPPAIIQTPPAIIKASEVVQTPPAIIQTPPAIIQTPPATIQTPPAIIQTPPVIIKASEVVQTPPVIIKASEVVQTPPAIIQTPPAIIKASEVVQTPPAIIKASEVVQTPPAIIKVSKVNQIRHNKSIDYIKSNKNEEIPVLEKINLLQLGKNTNKDVIYPNVFNFLSKDVIVPHINEYAPTQTQDTKSRKSLNLNISYGKFKKVNSGQPVYVPNHDQKIQIMNTFFGSIPPNNNLNKIYNSLNTIPSYAQGGTIQTPQIIVAGEKGKERIIPEKQIKENMVSSINQSSRTSSTEAEEMPALVGLGNSKLGPIYSSSSSINMLMRRFSTEGLPKFDGYHEK